MGTGRWVLVLNHLATSWHTAVLHFDVFACILVEFYGFMGFSLKVNGFLIVWLDSESVCGFLTVLSTMWLTACLVTLYSCFLCDFSCLPKYRKGIVADSAISAILAQGTFCWVRWWLLHCWQIILRLMFILMFMLVLTFVCVDVEDGDIWASTQSQAIPCQMQPMVSQTHSEGTVGHHAQDSGFTSSPHNCGNILPSHLSHCQIALLDKGHWVTGWTCPMLKTQRTMHISWWYFRSKPLDIQIPWQWQYLSKHWKYCKFDATSEQRLLLPLERLASGKSNKAHLAKHKKLRHRGFLGINRPQLTTTWRYFRFYVHLQTAKVNAKEANHKKCPKCP